MNGPYVGDTFYRYEETHYAPMADEWGEARGMGSIVVHLREFRVAKVTRYGVWLDNERFVLLGARKRYACPTVAEAAASFRARKRRQISIYQARIWSAERALEELERELSRNPIMDQKPLI